jgi:predicted dehydrogenase
VAIVADPVLERAQKLAQETGARAVADAREVIADSQVQLVIVATPNHLLAPWGLEAVRRGKHVLLEKPGARGAAELREVVAAAQATGARVKVGYNHRFHPAFLKVREILEGRMQNAECRMQNDGKRVTDNDERGTMNDELTEGAVDSPFAVNSSFIVHRSSFPETGPLMFLRGRYGHGGRLGYDREWRADPALSGGGELIDQGVHFIDLALTLLGDIERARGLCRTFFWDMPVEDNAFFLLEAASGAVGHFHVSCTEWKNLFSLEIYTRQAKLHWEGLGRSYGPERLTCYWMRPEMGPPDVQEFEFTGEDQSWARELEDFFASLDDEPRCRQEAEQAVRVLEIVERIMQNDE